MNRIARGGWWMLAALFVCASALHADPAPGDRWEPEIARFEAQNKEHPPTPGGILYTGSSTIRRWDLGKSQMPGVNRGFGGSQISDAIRFYDRIVLPHKPAVIVFYSGGNDLNAGKTPEAVAADFKTFVKLTHEKLPATRLIFVSTNPSLARWAKVELQRDLNKRVREIVAGDPQLSYVDCFSLLLGADGKPVKELFVADGLHLSDAGYQVLSGAVRPAIEAALQPAAKP